MSFEGKETGGGSHISGLNDEHLQRNKVAEQETSKFTTLTNFVPFLTKLQNNW
jgi:hypothetical protein